jgi:predicted glutamine amidotransferase
MCRMLGVVSATARSFGLLLEEAPRSLAWLSREHPDGWGVALKAGERRWTIHRSLRRAAEDLTFHQLATQLVGDLLLVHVRQKTHGPIAMENTHPFVSGRWVFTHNGKVDDVAFLERELSAERRAGLRGETDSERLFALILTRFDAARVTQGADPERVTDLLRGLGRELVERGDLGTASFLLSDGETLYAYRRGAPLHLLQRQGSDAAICRDCLGNSCVAVTTEPITDEPWLALDEGELVRITRGPQPRWQRISA